MNEPHSFGNEFVIVEKYYRSFITGLIIKTELMIVNVFLLRTVGGKIRTHQTVQIETSSSTKDLQDMFFSVVYLLHGDVFIKYYDEKIFQCTELFFWQKDKLNMSLTLTQIDRKKEFKRFPTRRTLTRIFSKMFYKHQTRQLFEENYDRSDRFKERNRDELVKYFCRIKSVESIGDKKLLPNHFRLKSDNVI